MLRGCLLSLAFLAALVFGYHYWFSQHFDGVEIWFAAFIAGFLCFCCLGALLKVRTGWRDLSLLSAARHGLPPSHGRRVAICGEIHPLGEPVIAPFSGSECVLCEYDFALNRPSSGDNEPNNTGKDFTGFLMNPCVIRAPLENVKLLGFPDLAEFPESTYRSLSAARRAYVFLATTTFEDKSGVKFLSALSALKEVWTDEDGQVSKHLRLGKPDVDAYFPPQFREQLNQGPAEDEAPETEAEEQDDEDFDEDEDDLAADEDFGNELPHETDSLPIMTEKRVAIGKPVCAFGEYQADKGGLLPRPGSGGLNSLIPGTADELHGLLSKKVWGNLWGGLIGLLVLHAVAFGLITIARHSPDQQRKRREGASTAVKAGDVKLLQRQIDRGLDVNARDSAGRTLLMETADPAIAKVLVERGADVNAIDENGDSALLHAARRGDLEVVRQLIASKADLNYRSPQYRMTALNAADHSQHTAVAALLRASGAEDEVITAQNGTPLPEGGGEQLAVIQAYLAAIQWGDAAALRNLSPTGDPAKFDDVDWDTWRSSRITEIAFAAGYERGDRATVTLQGTTPGGYQATWVYLLIHEQGRWKVFRESWLVERGQ